MAQIVLKAGMSSDNVQQVLALEGSIHEKIFVILTNFYVFLGLFLYISGAAVWLMVLSKADVTYAYPFMGLGLILTLLMGVFILGEPLSTAKVIGTLMIVGGIFVISQA